MRRAINTTMTTGTAQRLFVAATIVVFLSTVTGPIFADTIVKGLPIEATAIWWLIIDIGAFCFIKDILPRWRSGR